MVGQQGHLSLQEAMDSADQDVAKDETHEETSADASRDVQEEGGAKAAIERGEGSRSGAH